MNLKLANNATSALDANITNVATTLTVTAGEGAKFPNPTSPEYFYMTLQQGVTVEIVKVTARVTDTFTIVRAQDGTAGTAFTTGAKVELRLSKAQLAEYVTEKMLYEAANGIDRYKNYIFNSNALVDTAGWATFADAAASAPTDGTGGAPNITWNRNTTAPLNGIADFLFTKDAANRQGEGASYLCGIDKEDRNKQLGISFNTIVASGTYTNDDLQIFAYDVTNAALLNNGQAILNITANSVYTPHYASLYIPATCSSIRFIVYEATTNAVAYAIQFSNFKLTDNPFVYKDLIDSGHSRGFNGGAAVGLLNFATSATSNSANGYVLSSNRITFTKNITFNISADCLRSADTTTAVIFWKNSAGTTKLESGTSRGSTYRGTAAMTGAAIAGDYIEIYLYSYAQQIYWSITTISESEHVVTPAKSAIEEVHYDTYSSTSTYIKFANQITSTLSKLASVDNTTYTKFTALKKVLAKLSMNCFLTAGSGNQGISIFNSANVLQISKTQNVTSIGGTSFDYIMEPGDYAVVTTSAGTWNNVTQSQFSAVFVAYDQQVLSAIPVQQTCYIKDVKPANTPGGTFTSGAWRTRDLNVINETGSTTTGSCSFATLAANQFTLQPGTYKILVSAPASLVNNNRAVLYSITSASIVAVGSNGYNASGISAILSSEIRASVNISVPTTYEIQHICGTNGSFGYAVNLGGQPEVYTQVEITKIK